jgi:hypothetical protein
MTVAQFEEVSLYLGIGALMLFMLFIVYDLAKQSKAGRFGTLILFLALGLGLVGFGVKTVLELVLHV